MAHTGQTTSERAARFKARLLHAHIPVKPALPEGAPRNARLEPLATVRTILLAQTLATFGLEWAACLETSASLAQGQPVTLVLPNVADGPLAIVLLANAGVQLVLDSGA